MDILRLYSHNINDALEYIKNYIMNHEHTSETISFGYRSNVTISKVQDVNLYCINVYRNSVSHEPFYVACGQSGTFLYSTDGKQWNTGTINSSSSPNVAFDGLIHVLVDNKPVFIASGNKYINHSSDGINWNLETYTNASGSIDITPITYSNGYYVIADSNGNIYYNTSYENFFTSATFVTFSPFEKLNINPGYSIRFILYANGMFIFVCNKGYILYTTDLTDISKWKYTTTRIESNERLDLQCICWDSYNKVYVAVSSKGSVYTSKTLSNNNWDVVKITENDLQHVTYIKDIDTYVTIDTLGGVFIYNRSTNKWDTLCYTDATGLQYMAYDEYTKEIYIAGNGVIIKLSLPAIIKRTYEEQRLIESANPVNTIICSNNYNNPYNYLLVGSWQLDTSYNTDGMFKYIRTN